MSKLKWHLVLIISLSGFVFAGLTIFAVISGQEHWVALLMLFGVAVSMARLAPLAPKRNAFAAGFLAALLAVWTQAAFIELYFENNPSYRLIEIPFALGARAYTFLSAPIGAMVAGCFALLLTWPLAKILRPN